MIKAGCLALPSLSPLAMVPLLQEFRLPVCDNSVKDTCDGINHATTTPPHNG